MRDYPTLHLDTH